VELLSTIAARCLYPPNNSVAVISSFFSRQRMVGAAAHERNPSLSCSNVRRRAALNRPGIGTQHVELPRLAMAPEPDIELMVADTKVYRGQIELRTGSCTKVKTEPGRWRQHIEPGGRFVAQLVESAVRVAEHIENLGYP
jgi:hypothetical protein